MSGPSGALGVVVVSYNVAALLAQCLTSVLREVETAGEAARVVVVDNASRDGSAALVQERFPAVTVIQNQDNQGFGAGCNQGLAAAGDVQRVLFLNPDTELGPGALRALLARLDATPAAAVIGPRLVYPDGRPQPSRRRFPTPATLLLESTPLEWRLPPWRLLDDSRYAAVPDTAASQVDWVSGAVLLARSAALREVGGFDPTFFMYFEEVDLCRRLAARGWQTWYEPAAVVVHHHSQSADQNLPAKDRLYFGSKYAYTGRYFGATTATLVRAVASLAFGAEYAIQRLRRDPLRSARYAALAAWHASGLLPARRRGA